MTGGFRGTLLSLQGEFGDPFGQSEMSYTVSNPSPKLFEADSRNQ
jgi:hypothetical protein